MATERQQRCPQCGPVLARTVDPMTPGEKLVWTIIVLFTCGVGLLAVIPYAIWRGSKSRGFRCTKCGAQTAKI